MPSKKTKSVSMALEISNPVFSTGDVLVIVGDAEFQKRAQKRYDIPPAEGPAKALAGTTYTTLSCNPSRPDIITGRVIELGPCDFKVDWYKTCVHEVSHMVGKLLRDIGVRERADGDDETRAYLSEFYFGEIIAKLAKVKKATFKERNF